MNFDKLKEFIEIAREAGASQLEFKDGDKEFAVNFPYSDALPAHSMGMPTHANEMSKPSVGVSAKDQGLIEITSPFVGTYYSSSSPESPAYVKVGDKVSKGDVLCIVEAMKIMIESENVGEVVEVCVENESYVEFGQPLFKIRP
jgi:acetyl-CoA carboxylase biotin carboxyl carrier protein